MKIAIPKYFKMYNENKFEDLEEEDWTVKYDDYPELLDGGGAFVLRAVDGFQQRGILLVEHAGGDALPGAGAERGARTPLLPRVQGREADRLDSGDVARFGWAAVGCNRLGRNKLRASSFLCEERGQVGECGERQMKQ